MKKVFLTLTLGLFFVAFANAQDKTATTTAVKEDVKTEALAVSESSSKEGHKSCAGKNKASCAGKEKASCADKSSKAACCAGKKAKATEVKKEE